MPKQTLQIPQMKTPSNGMDDLQMLKDEYLSNHILGHNQIVNLTYLDDQSKVYNFFKWRPLPKEEDLKY